MKTIIIAGPSGSGKTFLANYLIKHINNTIIVNTDSYYRDDFFVKFLSLFMNDIYDRIISIKKRELSNTIKSIYNNEKELKFYNYDFRRKKSTQLIRKMQNETKFLIIEGIFSHRIDLNYKTSLNIFCRESKKICYQRRLKRDQLERGRNKKEVSRKFNKSWELYLKDLNSYIIKNDIYEVNCLDKNSYKKLVNKLKKIDIHKKTKVNI
tara:strand:- start:49 stop:675 length:627 start_codon:yes stop_codon:yes gene_type:complete